MPARGRRSGEKIKKNEKKILRSNPQSRGHTTATHNIVAATKRSTHPLTAAQQKSTAERSTTAVTPSNRSTHPCITAVQQMTYHGTAVVEVERESGGTTMGPENSSTKHVKHS